VHTSGKIIAPCRCWGVRVEEEDEGLPSQLTASTHVILVGYEGEPALSCWKNECFIDYAFLCCGRERCRWPVSWFPTHKEVGLGVVLLKAVASSTLVLEVTPWHRIGAHLWHCLLRAPPLHGVWVRDGFTNATWSADSYKKTCMCLMACLISCHSWWSRPPPLLLAPGVRLVMCKRHPC
jgi:hypothetical protein